MGLADSTPARWVLALLALLVAVAIDVATFLFLFLWLPGGPPSRQVAGGALVGAAGLEVLKVAGTWLIVRTTNNPVYGTFAVIVGLLIWINVVSRWTLFVAAWTVTVSSGRTASPGPPRVATAPGPA
jgi:membrane protein